MTIELEGGMRDATIYSDGSCEGNPGRGGWAAIVDVGSDRRELTGAEPKTTNNRMELSAVIAGLRALAEPSNVRVVTDSQYVVNGMTQWIHGWRRRAWRSASGTPVKNRDLWEALDAEARKHRVHWEWVRGHDGHPENERADSLAREAIRELD